MNQPDLELPLYRKAGEEVRGWLGALAFSHFVTFNFNRDMTLEASKKALKRFLARWDRRVLGNKFHKHPRTERSLLIGFVEHIDSNLHYHAFMLPACNGPIIKSDFASVAPRIWEQLIPSGQLHVAKVSDDGWLPAEEGMISADHLQRIATYITKDLDKERNYENFVISSEFLPPTIH